MTGASAAPPNRMRTGSLPGFGPVIYADVIIPDDAPLLVREGLARRALIYSGAGCPCGATLDAGNRAARRQAKRSGRLHVRLEHEADCPAITSVLVARILRWKAARGG